MSSELRPERLEAYADGELSPQERVEIETIVRRDARAAASVTWWQNLRKQCKGAVESEAVPLALAAEIRRGIASQRRTAGRRLIRVGVPGLAAAALFFAIWLWPRPADGTPVDATAFAAIYENCAVHGRHDTLGVRLSPPGTCLSKFKCKMPFTCCVPNLSSCGRYHADGGCTCSPPGGMKVVHVYFRADEAPDVVISAFSVDRPIQISRTAGGAAKSACKATQVDPATLEDVSVVTWRRESRSYVLVSRMPESRLRELATGAALTMVEHFLDEHGVEVALAAQP